MKKVFLFILFLIASFSFITNIVTAQEEPDPNTCFYEGNPTRPGGSCKERVPYVNKDLTQYTVSCAVNPQVKLSYNACTSPPITEFAGLKYIEMRLLIDFEKVQLGGLGPNEDAWQSNSLDQLARVYPYNGLADKPLSLGDNPREVFRTWWRLLPLRQQLNAKSAFLRRANKSGGLGSKFKAWIGSYGDVPIFKEARFPYIPTNPTETAPTANNNPPLPDKTGTNIGYLHTNPFFQSAASGKPTTFLVPIDNPEAIKNFVNFYSGASPRIARVTGLTQSTPNSIIKDAAKALSSSLGSNDYVIFGNELNAPIEGYCSDYSSLTSCGSAYAAQFGVFQGSLSGPKLAAAPTNTSHATHDAAQFLSGARSAYQRASVTAHNVYDFKGGPCAYNNSRCSIDSWEWERNYIGSSKPYIFTEYGLAPPSLDTNLVEVLQFITTPPSSGEPAAITPLIRNVCTGVSGAWLIYDGTNLYNDAGSIIDPATCSVILEDFSLEELSDVLPPCLKNYPVCSRAETVYYNLPDNTRDMYDALQPFNFDNVRGYLALTYVDPPQDRRSGILAENLPYIQALRDILADPAGGILTAISPNWLNQARYVTQNIFTSDAIVNPPLRIPPLYPAQGELTSQDYQDELPLREFNTIVEGYAESLWGQDGSCRVTSIKEVKNTLPSPETYPVKIPNPTGILPPQELPSTKETTLEQNTLIPVSVEEISSSPYDSNGDGLLDSCARANGSKSICSPDPDGVCPLEHKVSMRLENSRSKDFPVRSEYGRTIAILTNPKMTDVSRLLSGPKNHQNPLLFTENPSSTVNYSLYFQLLPRFLRSTSLTSRTDTPIWGKGLEYDAQLNSFSGQSAGLNIDPSAGTSKKDSYLLPRKGGQGEIDLCQLRNFWLRPSSLQAGKYQDCADPESFLSAGLAPPISSDSQCTQDQSGIASTAIYNEIVNAAKWANIPTDILVSVIKIEGGCANGGLRICSVDNSAVNSANYLEEGVEFPTNCPISWDTNGNGTVGSKDDTNEGLKNKGPLQFYHFLSTDWGIWSKAVNIATGSQRSTNICNIKDSIYAAAWALSAGKNSCPQANYPVSSSSGTWTQEQKEWAVSRWALGCVDERCAPGGFADKHCQGLAKACSLP